MTNRPPDHSDERWTSVRGQQFWRPPLPPPDPLSPLARPRSRYQGPVPGEIEPLGARDAVPPGQPGSGGPPPDAAGWFGAAAAGSPAPGLPPSAPGLPPAAPGLPPSGPAPAGGRRSAPVDPYSWPPTYPGPGDWPDHPSSPAAYPGRGWPGDPRGRQVSPPFGPGGGAYPPASFGRLPADGWGAPQPMSRRRRTAIKLIGIVVVFAVAVAAVNIVWDLLRHDATEVPSAANVALGPAGLPEGYEWAGEYQQGGDRLICGPVTWELVGDYPVGGRNAVEEAVELASQMTGVAINPVEEVAVPAVEITFEYVSSAELESHTTGSGDHAIGLAITQHTTFGITESEVLLDREFFDNALSSNPDQAVLTVLHEIGHAFGLGHSDLDQSLMYPYISARTRIFEEDVAAFAAVAPDCG